MEKAKKIEILFFAHKPTGQINKSQKFYRFVFCYECWSGYVLVTAALKLLRKYTFYVII